APLLHEFAEATTHEEIASCLRLMAVPEFSARPEVIVQTVLERAVRGQREVLHVLLSRIIRNGVQGAFSPEQFARLKMPVDVVWGERDPVLPFSQIRNAPASFRI